MVDPNHIRHEWSPDKVDLPFCGIGNKCCQLLPWQPLMQKSVSEAYRRNKLVSQTILDMNDPRKGRFAFWGCWQQMLPIVAMVTTYAKFCFRSTLPQQIGGPNHIRHEWSPGEVDLAFGGIGNKCCQLLPLQLLMQNSFSGAYCWN